MTQNTLPDGPNYSAFSELTDQPKSWLSQWAIHCPLPKAMILVVVPTTGWVITALIKNGGSVAPLQLLGIIVLFGMLLGTLLIICYWERDGTNCQEARNRSVEFGDESSGPGAT